MTYHAGGIARLTPVTLSNFGPYAIVLDVEESLVNAGTDLAKLHALTPSALASVVPTGVVLGRVSWVGPAAARIDPALELGSWLIAKAPHADRVALDVTTSDYVATGHERPGWWTLLARHACLASKVREALCRRRVESVAIVGLGSLGQVCLRAAASIPSIEACAVDRHRGRVDAAARAVQGKHHLARELPRDARFEAMVLASPVNQPIEPLLSSIADGGMLVALGRPAVNTHVDLAELFSRCVSIEVFHERQQPPGTLIKSGLDMLCSSAMHGSAEGDLVLSLGVVEERFAEAIADKEAFAYLLIDWRG